MKKRKTNIFVLMSIFLIISSGQDIYAATAAYLESALLSEAVVLMDGETGQVLYEKNMRRRMYPASITKVLTALVALERGQPDGVITMSHDAVFSVEPGSSGIALDVGEQLTFEQAMYALAIMSANDAANGIAEYIGGTTENFAALMNARAREAGARESNFVNAHGLPDEDHYTTAYDMARITMAAARLPRFLEIFGTDYYEMPPTNMKDEARYFWSTNALLTGAEIYDGVVASKTGWTTAAGHTLVTVARRGGGARKLIAVVMKSAMQTDKWADTRALLDFGFDQLKEVTFSAEEIFQGNYPVINADGSSSRVDLLAGGFSALIPIAATKGDIEITYDVANAKATFSLKSELRGLTPSLLLGEVALTLRPIQEEPPVPSEPAANENDGDYAAEPESGLGFARFILLAVLVTIGLFASAILVLFARSRAAAARRRRRQRGF
ncbi:MAG: D-alanyl-D-alanine carboxypeptidase [Clostridiales bacterium]|jgi:D-alanyl-D-alanine carboxypeptidase (penicillin-binding protein 5/6)|nr:D-alanyl-D-alanine carboxypeptidase [Clostridiales bacterium]